MINKWVVFVTAIFLIFVQFVWHPLVGVRLADPIQMLRKFQYLRLALARVLEPLCVGYLQIACAFLSTGILLCIAYFRSIATYAFPIFVNLSNSSKFALHTIQNNALRHSQPNPPHPKQNPTQPILHASSKTHLSKINIYSHIQRRTILI